MADTRRGRDHGPEGHHPERGSRETLERIVRGCAAASRTESEFVRALREHDVRVRPRYPEGGRSAVVGYSVRLPVLTVVQTVRSGLVEGGWHVI
jgi:hypothetical protein